MKRLYFSIISIIAAFTLSLQASAQEDFAYTINWDTPGAVTISLDNATGTPVSLDPSATSYVVTKKVYAYVHPAEGYIIKSVTDQDGNSYRISGYQSYGGQYVSLSCYSSQNGYSFNIQTEKLEKTGEFDLEVVNGEYALNLYLNNSKDKELSTFSAPELKKGVQKVDLTPYDSEIVVSKDNGKPLYSIKRNGEPVEVESETRVPVADGDKIEIQVYEVEPERVSVTISFTEGAEGSLNSVYNQASTKLIPYSAIKDKGGVIECDAGSSLRFNFNEDYIINGLTVNGSPAKVPSEGESFTTVIDTNTTLLIDATAKVYEDIEGVVYVSGPIEALRFATGIMEYDVEIPISEGEDLTDDVVFTFENGKTFTIPKGTARKYTLMMPGKSRKFFYDAKPGYWLQEAVLANPDDPDYIYASLAVLAENAPLYVKVGAISNDTKAVVFYDGEDDAAGFYAQNVRIPGRLDVDGIDGKFLKNGYSVIEFDSDYHASFSVGKSGGLPSNELVAYLDGKKLKYNEDSMTYTGFNMNEGSVLKVFSVPTGTVPSQNTVKFDIDPDMEVEVTYDLVKTHDPASALECIGKTLVSVKPVYDAAVTLDDKDLEPDVEGRYEFMTSKKSHNLKIGASAGISEIAGDDNNCVRIYNLQGIRMTEPVEKLPAGVYIVNGRKMIVR